MTRLRTAILGGIVIAAAILVVLAGRACEDAGIGVESQDMDAAVWEIFEQLADSANELRGAEVETDVFFAGATVGNPGTLTYTYTVAGVADRSFDRQISRMARDQLNRESCADPILQNAFDGGGAVRYVYLSPGGTRVLVIDVDRESCQKPE